MTHGRGSPVRKGNRRRPSRSIARNLKRRPRSIRAAQNIAAGITKSTRGIKLLAPGPRARTVGGKTKLASLIRSQTSGRSKRGGGPLTRASSVSRAPKKRNPRGGVTRRITQARRSTQRDLRGSRPRQVGPPKVGFRTVKGRGGKRITIKRPRPRSA